MKLLHLSDLHIGKHLNEFPLIDDQRFVLERACDLIESRGIDAVIVAGDVYDKSMPSAEAVALVDRFFDAVARTGAALFVVSGNHDSAERIAYASRLLERNRVFVSPVFDGTISHHALTDDEGPVVFWLIPFLKPASVRPHFPDLDIVDYTDALRAVIDACPIDQSVRNVAIAHQFVTFGGTEPERSASELSLGGLDNVDASVFDAFDYVALGHVHRPQRIGRDTMRYSGSPLKYSYSEIAYPKTAPLIELGSKGSIDIDLVELAPLHDVRRISGPLDQLVSPDIVASQTADDYLHVVLTDEEPQIDALARLRTVYPRVVGIDYDNTRTNAAGATASALTLDESIAPLDLFDELFLAQNGMPLSDAQRTMVQTALVAAEVVA